MDGASRALKEIENCLGSLRRTGVREEEILGSLIRHAVKVAFKGFVSRKLFVRMAKSVYRSMVSSCPDWLLADRQRAAIVAGFPTPEEAERNVEDNLGNLPLLQLAGALVGRTDPLKNPPCGNPDCGVSTGIHDGPTFGSGELDDNGYWERPCGPCARRWEAEHPEDGPAWPLKWSEAGTN